MGVPHDHRSVLPPPQLLHCIEIHTALYQPGSECMAEIMEPEVLNPRLLHGHVKRSQQVPVVEPVIVAVRKYVIGFLATRTSSHGQDFHNPLVHWKGIDLPFLKPDHLCLADPTNDVLSSGDFMILD